MDNVEKILFDKLLDLAEKRLSNKEAVDLMHQLSISDAETQADWEWIQSFYRSLESPPALQSTRSNLLQAFRQHRRGEWRRRLQAIVAITFDSWSTRSSLAPVGARSAETTSATRQLVFSTDTLDIALELRAHKTTTVITGQILQNEDIDLAAWTIELFADGDQIAVTTSDDLGEFEITASSNHHYQLALRHLQSKDNEELLTQPFGLHQ